MTRPVSDLHLLFLPTAFRPAPSRDALAQSIRSTFEAVVPAHLTIATQVAPLSEVETVWSTSTGKPRVVFSIDQ